MSDITDWEPLMKSEHDFKGLYSQQVAINETLLTEAKTLRKQAIDDGNALRKLQSDYDSYKKSTERELQRLKNDIAISLRAIDLCILASITTNNSFLTHRQRNFRMQHIHQIICNESDRFGDRKLTSYEDDF